MHASYIYHTSTTSQYTSTTNINNTHQQRSMPKRILPQQFLQIRRNLSTTSPFIWSSINNNVSNNEHIGIQPSTATSNDNSNIPPIVEGNQKQNILPIINENTDFSLNPIDKDTTDILGNFSNNNYKHDIVHDIYNNISCYNNQDNYGEYVSNGETQFRLLLSINDFLNTRLEPVVGILCCVIFNLKNMLIYAL